MSTILVVTPEGADAVKGSLSEGDVFASTAALESIADLPLISRHPAIIRGPDVATPLRMRFTLLNCEENSHGFGRVSRMR